MRKLVFGLIVGVVIGLVVGSTIIAPRLKLPTSHRDTRAGEHIADDAKKKYRIANLTELKLEKQPIRLDLAGAYSSALPQFRELGARLENTVLELSESSLHLKLREPRTIAPNNEIFDAVRSKAIAAAFGVPNYWANKNSAFQLYSSVPFGPPLQEYLSWVYDGGGKEILEKLYKRNDLHGIICGALGSEGSGWFRKPVDNLETFKTLRLGISGLGSMVARQLGAKTLELDESQIFAALKNDMIDGAEASLHAIDKNLKLRNVARYFYFPSWHQPATLLHLIINAEVWRNLPTNKQKQIEVACSDNITYGLALSQSRQFNTLKDLTRQGARLQTWSPEIISKLKESWRKTRNELAMANPEFKYAWKSLETFRKKYAISREISSGELPERID